MLRNNIAAIRKAKKLTQKDLAVGLKTSRQTVSLYECGQKHIPPHHIKIICKVLGCDEADLFK